MHVVIDPPPEVQPHVPRLRAERNATDRRNAVVRSRARHDHALAAWGQRATHQGLKQEARFVQESNVAAAPVGLTQDPRELVGFPAFGLLVVALACPLLRLVAGPLQPTPEQPPGIIGMILNAKPSLDELADTSGSPQLGGEAMGGGPL